jgi:hypothetical protein
MLDLEELPSESPTMRFEENRGEMFKNQAMQGEKRLKTKEQGKKKGFTY